MPSEADIIKRVRLELGDEPKGFQTVVEGDSVTTTYDIPVGEIDPATLVVYTLTGSTHTTLSSPGNYTFDQESSSISLHDAIDPGTFLFVQGNSVGMFTDTELQQFVRDAVVQHTYGTSSRHRYRDSHGFIQYEVVERDIYSLPEIEILPVAILASVNALWTLSTDASTDIDIISAEGTNIPRTQRFAQLHTQIAALTDRYRDYCMRLNVGLYRIEMLTLRRVSLSTGRYVPVFTHKEYDDTAYPGRQIPEIDSQDTDPYGPASPAFGMGY